MFEVLRGTGTKRYEYWRVSVGSCAKLVNNQGAVVGVDEKSAEYSKAWVAPVQRVKDMVQN